MVEKITKKQIISQLSKEELESFKKKEKTRKCECCGKEIVMMPTQKFCPSCALYLGKLRAYTNRKKTEEKKKKSRNRTTLLINTKEGIRLKGNYKNERLK